MIQSIDLQVCFLQCTPLIFFSSVWKSNNNVVGLLRSSGAISWSVSPADSQGWQQVKPFHPGRLTQRVSQKQVPAERADILDRLDLGPDRREGVNHRLRVFLLNNAQPSVPSHPGERRLTLHPGSPPHEPRM